MRWKKEYKDRETRTRKRFAWWPIFLSKDNSTIWLESYYINETYNAYASGHSYWYTNSTWSVQYQEEQDKKKEQDKKDREWVIPEYERLFGVTVTDYDAVLNSKGEFIHNFYLNSARELVEAERNEEERENFSLPYKLENGLDEFILECYKALGINTYELNKHEEYLINKTEEEHHIIGLLKVICEETLCEKITLVSDEAPGDGVWITRMNKVITWEELRAMSLGEQALWAIENGFGHEKSHRFKFYYENQPRRAGGGQALSVTYSWSIRPDLADAWTHSQFLAFAEFTLAEPWIEE